MIYAITAGNPRAVIEAVAPLVDFVVLREPTLPPWAAELDAARVILHARMPGAEALARARGFRLHLPDDGRPAPDLPHGRSTHTVAAARTALAAADYVFLSPIWAPASKPLERPPLGPAVLTEVPAVALGGVTPARLAACPHGAAVLGGIFGAPDPVAAALRYRDACPRAPSDGPSDRPVRPPRRPP